MKYVGTYSDPKDIVTKDKLEAVASRVSTNEDNIAMAESDIEGLQTTVGTLQTNVNNVQTALTSKQDTVVGGASTITADNLTANRALVSNSSGKVAVSSVTSTELGYLDGVTSNVQTQLDKKLEKAPVTSVNNKTGAVQLNATDVGALPGTTIIPSKTSQLTNDSGFITIGDVPDAPVTSVNGKTGAVALNANDVGAVSKTGDTMTGNLTVGSASLQTNGYVTGTWLKTTANIALSSAASKIAVINDGWVYSRTTGQIKSDIGLGNVDNVKQYSASNPPPYPVTSVNGKTGAVTLGKSDVKLGNVDNVRQYSDTNPPPYPVTSVNGKTGAVNLTSSDIGAATASDIYTALNRTNAVDIANSNYTTYMARGEALYSYETTPSANGCIAWQYE